MRSTISRFIVSASALLLVVVSAAPAAAIHQYCGDGAEGIHLGGYPDSTSRGNGHPIDGNGSWAGVGAVVPLERTLYGLERAETHLDNIVTLVSLPDKVPTEIVALVQAIVKEGIRIAKTAVGATLLEAQHRNAEVDQCGSTLMGDMIDATFVAHMEEELALLGAARATGVVGEGARLAGSSAFLLPDDGILDVTPDGSTYSDRAGHDSESLAAAQFFEGFADADFIGVAIVVRNAIAHLKGHGVATGEAEILWKEAMDLLSAGQVRDAYGVFADAYYRAVTAF